MTEQDPNPAALPEAIPVLSYERQTYDGAMEWVVRFVGAWVICTAAASLLFHVAHVINARSAWLSSLRIGTTTPSLLGDLASIVFGVAIVKQRRFGFHGKLAVLVMVLGISLISTITTNRAMVSLAIMPPKVLQTGVLFAVLLSVLRRADARGVIEPVRMDRTDARQDASSIGFLISRMGWVYLAQGGMVFVHFATLPLFIWGGGTMASWNWQSSIQVVTLLTVGMCGLLLLQRRVWALWWLAVALPLDAGSQLLVVWTYILPSGYSRAALATTLIPTVVGTAANVCLLCALARRAGCERST